jgi:type IV pilus assembly protein PilC
VPDSVREWIAPVQRELLTVFHARISLKTLALLCKSLATMLHSGVPLLRSLETVSKKTGNALCRQKLTNIRDEVRDGTDIAEAFRMQQRYFPDLTIDMIAVGEQTGALPEVLDGLAAHYDNLVRLRRMLIGLITWPAIQLFAAILIVGFVILVLGWITPAPVPGEKPYDILGLGLTGTSGAILWFVLSFGTIFGIGAAYYSLSTLFRTKRFLDRLLMKIPVVGGCLQAFAIARFSWAFAMTQQTGMPIRQSLELSFRATGNGAFMGAAGQTCRAVMEGEELGVALADTELFPEEYLSLVQVAETSGTVPETLERLSPQFEEQARRSLGMLAVAISWGVWLFVAGLVIYIVINFVLQYVGLLNSAMKGL